MQQKKAEKTKTDSNKKARLEQEKKCRENAAFKKKYFEYYDDIKISYKEDW